MPRTPTAKQRAVLEAKQVALKDKEAAIKAEQAATREALRQLKAAQRLERQAEVGKLVDEAGLLDEANATLVQLFAWAKVMLSDPERWELVQGLMEKEPCGGGGV